MVDTGTEFTESVTVAVALDLSVITAVITAMISYDVVFGFSPIPSLSNLISKKVIEFCGAVVVIGGGSVVIGGGICVIVVGVNGVMAGAIFPSPG